jgi:uncharacterized membrane protein
MAQEQRNEVMLCERVVRCWDGVWEVYRRLVEDWRRYDAMLWEIPFGTMAAVGAILTLALSYIPSSEHVIRAALFIALAWFTLIMMHLSYKVRHFQIERAACIEAIEHLCTGFAVPYETGRAYRFVLRAEIERNPLRPLEHGFYIVRSYHLVYAMYIGLIAILLYLVLIESLLLGILGIVAIALFIIAIMIVSQRRR